MTRDALDQAVTRHIEETRAALQTVYDALNQGQKKKLVKDEGVKTLFDRYGVVYDQ